MIRFLGSALLVVAAAAAVAYSMTLFFPDAPARHRAAFRPGEPRDFSLCFESVVPRMQFYCEDGSIWTRSTDGWIQERPSTVPQVPRG